MVAYAPTEETLVYKPILRHGHLQERCCLRRDLIDYLRRVRLEAVEQQRGEIVTEASLSPLYLHRRLAGAPIAYHG